MSDLINNLPKVEFADKDAETTLAEIIARYEAASGSTLYPGDPVRLFLETIAYELAYQRSLIDFTGKMNLLAYAAGDYLDHIGAMIGVARLASQRAVCTVRFSLDAPLGLAVIVPEGTRVADANGTVFASAEPQIINIGTVYCDIKCVAESLGVTGNGLLPGQISKMVDIIAYIASVANITASAGGADIESDDNLRERIRLAPESFSVAGSRGAYEFWARSAHQSIESVAVHSPTPGVIDVYPLLSGGRIPEQNILDMVSHSLTDAKVRPLTDDVHVYAPVAAEYTLNLKYYIDKDVIANAIAIQSAVAAAVDNWVYWQSSKLGRDINPSELIKRVITAGAKRAEVISPAYSALEFNEVAQCTSQNIIFGGAEDG